MNFFSSSEKRKSHQDDAGSDSGSIVQMEGTNFNRNDILICATNGKIYALHKRDGSRLWRAKFPTSAYGNIVSVFVTDYDDVIVGAVGKTACMKLMTGETKWINKMPGFGAEEVSVITTPSRFLRPLEITNNPNALPPSYGEEREALGEPIVFGCSRGKVMAMNSRTGEKLWEYNCPGGWYNVPVALVEPPSLEAGRPYQLIYVGSGKWVYCLRATTGQVMWSVKVTNAIFTLNYIALATPWSSRLAAESHTAFSQNPIAQARDNERKNE
ncbi:hypothetical protein CU098_013285 [Rhizopus stolonifer]|uniref:Pyrrolo-quinoline quinone repeat domain-containing protein n=1 Tax=Rhizopus stolonifer TaxID=4846 RepID=A0A367KU12_RHIST|nr:hypothetical protein CU098_013285 [Rhizopus stolonifer]